jgi:hypothetical protein
MFSKQTRKFEKYAWPRWPGIFFKLTRFGYTLRVTSQASYSPEYITPTQKENHPPPQKMLN